MATTSPPPQIVAEEQQHLDRIRQTLLENPEGPARSEQDLVQELLQLQEDYREARIDDEKGLINQQIMQMMALLDQQRSAQNKATVDPDNPYFAHLQLAEEGRTRDIFLGRATRLSHGLRIVDWRNAPISRLFYQYDEGDEYEEEMGGRAREGRIAARRTLHVADGTLERVGTPAETWVREGHDWRRVDRADQRLAGGEGSSLRQGGSATSSLGHGQTHRADKHLPDIAALIDPDQFDLITRNDRGVVVLRGSAGSGKTTVALHRIAWLAFERGEAFNASNVLVIVWGRAMRDYVQHVLPALGVHGVAVSTWTTWARKRTKAHFSGLPTIIADDTPEPVTRLKLHPAVARALESVVRRRRAAPTWQQAVEDWEELLTNRSLLRDVLPDTFSDAALDRALRWTQDQSRNVSLWLEGDREADARLDPEDDALLLRAYQLRVGPLRRAGNRALTYGHMVLDEVQDFSPVEVQVLLGACDKRQSVTMAGDVRQHISTGGGFSTWQAFLGSIGVESTALSTLEVSYRSTHPIIRFALEVLADDTEPLPRTTRDGPPVELFRFSDHGACVAFLSEELRALQRTEPGANVALLTPNPATSRLYAEGLERADLIDVRLIEQQRFAFAPGIDVVEVDQVKGLEFDYVVIIEASAQHWPDTPHHRRLLHVAATRAVHQLWVTSVGTPSPILPSAKR